MRPLGHAHAGNQCPDRARIGLRHRAGELSARSACRSDGLLDSTTRRVSRGGQALWCPGGRGCRSQHPSGSRGASTTGGAGHVGARACGAPGACGIGVRADARSSSSVDVVGGIRPPFSRAAASLNPVKPGPKRRSRHHPLLQPGQARAGGHPATPAAKPVWASSCAAARGMRISRQATPAREPPEWGAPAGPRWLLATRGITGGAAAVRSPRQTPIPLKFTPAYPTDPSARRRAPCRARRPHGATHA